MLVEYYRGVEIASGLACPGQRPGVKFLLGSTMAGQVEVDET